MQAYEESGWSDTTGRAMGARTRSQVDWYASNPNAAACDFGNPNPENPCIPSNTRTATRSAVKIRPGG